MHGIYVTGKLCNQEFHEMPKDSRHFAKSPDSLRHFELQAFHEMPKSDAPIIFSFSPVTTGV